MNFIGAPPTILFEEIVRRALLEDLGRAGDLTTQAVVSADQLAEASVVSRQDGSVSGMTIAAQAFRLLDPSLAVEVMIQDGEDCAAGQDLLRIAGAARPILSGERTALNFLGRLCGIATATREVVRAVEGTACRIVCTRKTTPGLRLLEKAAVRDGGGWNHRFGLDDAVLIKDNHLALSGGVSRAVGRVRGSVGHWVKIEVEAQDLEMVQEAIRAKVDAILLDNMEIPVLRRAIGLCKGRVLTEVSGGMRPETAGEVARLGADLISVGWITHSAPALDLSLRVR